jgi:hypothetical protein
MQLPTVSPAGILLLISSPATFWPKAKEENFARVDAKELPDLLLEMESYDGDALTRLAMLALGTASTPVLMAISAQGDQRNLL